MMITHVVFAAHNWMMMMTLLHGRARLVHLSLLLDDTLSIYLGFVSMLGLGLGLAKGLLSVMLMDKAVQLEV